MKFTTIFDGTFIHATVVPYLKKPVYKIYLLMYNEVRDNPLNRALMMSPRMVTKRLQANCQARRTNQQPPDQQPER
ncbi:hypothetical protein T265_11758 [Opisthorchis viverrini]|uniref:Uncharacterized protein n=1 Tax=Opisthorchis viverrini TaxID=6198 RepID=A0A074ZWA4_OPIVI|nr:hypothetical protein T265_11758 [Opisthorchis viverrini]KER19484.1 hypothetical protein T265_11758 [Opisthorchis viverrini]